MITRRKGMKSTQSNETVNKNIHGGKEIKFDVYEGDRKKVYYVFPKDTDKQAAKDIFARDKKVSKFQVVTQYGYVSKDTLYFDEGHENDLDPWLCRIRTGDDACQRTY
jgi:hypothetical protein